MMIMSQYPPYTDPEISIKHKVQQDIFDLEEHEQQWLKDQIKDKLDAEDEGELLVALASDMGVI